MTWLFWLTLTVIVAAAIAVFGVQPRGTRAVARTQLMGVARLLLIVLILFLLYLAFRARG
jgi:hypothetical protein